MTNKQKYEVQINASFDPCSFEEGKIYQHVWDGKLISYILVGKVFKVIRVE
jgi:hypothetical protein